MLNPVVARVTANIQQRSAKSRAAYLSRMERAKKDGPYRFRMAGSNLAHCMAVNNPAEGLLMRDRKTPNLGIITAYNDMVSAHHNYQYYPPVIKDEALKHGAVAQVASGVPAMCDGVTQGEDGMDLSLLSREVIALATAVGLSHNAFDGVALLGICDKIFPGLLIGALQFGHLSVIAIPGGPMTTGLPNKEKARTRQLYAQGKVSAEALLESECKSYHSSGTCTFYGTANSNQLIAEVMGLHLPGTSFINANAPQREAVTRAAVKRLVAMTHLREAYTPIADIVNEKAIVNAIVACLATGASTNQTMHLVAIARAAGILINWDDFAELSEAVPLIVRIYPNGAGDINDFQAAGGMALLFRELLAGGLMHEDVQTVAGPGLARYTQVPDDSGTQWIEGPTQSCNPEIFASLAAPFDNHGGLVVLDGNLGRAVIKTSALRPGHDHIRAAARVFADQHDLLDAFQRGELQGDLVAVVRFQGPAANGMPELHKLTTPLAVLMDQGHKVALVTDGRLSGASGKVPAAIHVTPEALQGGNLAKLRDGDIIEIDIHRGVLRVELSADELAEREAATFDVARYRQGMGRELFAALRGNMTSAEQGASALFIEPTVFSDDA